MKKNRITFSIVFVFLFTHGFAQQWTEPVTITNMEGHDYAADFTVDNNGVIHCVWVNNPDYWNKWVYYSYSEDDGQTWSQAEKVSEMDSIWRHELRIVHDSENNLYFSYIHNYRSVYESVVLMHKRVNGHWSEGDTISGDYYGILRNQLAIDHNNRLYSLFSWVNETYMSYCDNDQWSDFIKIPEGTQDGVIVKDVAVDNENMLHALFIYRKYGTTNDSCYALYQKFDGQNRIVNEICGGPMRGRSNDWGIDTDTGNKPHITYWECDPLHVGVPLDTTIYRYRSDEGWSLPETVVTDPMYMQIVLDQNNCPHIFDKEKEGDGYMLVHHYKTEGKWGGFVVAETHKGGISYAVDRYLNKLFVIHTSDIYSFENTLNLEFTKTDITIGTGHEIETPSFDLNLFPNPFAHELHIKFEINNPGSLSVCVYDYSGKLIKTLLDTEGETGKYELAWDGIGQNGQKQSSGAYLLRLRCGNRILSKGIQLINP